MAQVFNSFRSAGAFPFLAFLNSSERSPTLLRWIASGSCIVPVVLLLLLHPGPQKTTSAPAKSPKKTILHFVTGAGEIIIVSISTGRMNISLELEHRVNSMSIKYYKCILSAYQALQGPVIWTLEGARVIQNLGMVQNHHQSGSSPA